MEQIKAKIASGELICFLGMGVFENTQTKEGKQLPFDSDSMILSLNNGRAMSPRLMYEYSRAAMSLEQRKGREFIVQMTNHIFSSQPYTPPKVYEWLKQIQPPYVIDVNMDDSLQKAYDNVQHYLIMGIARITANGERFVIYEYDVNKQAYEEIPQEQLSTQHPILFKPMGSIKPEMSFIISDADFVDWLTEAMGGFAMPTLLKTYRKDKAYLFLGVDFSRDTFRMVANELTIGLKGGILVHNKDSLTKKEDKFIQMHDLEPIKMALDEFIKAHE